MHTVKNPQPINQVINDRKINPASRRVQKLLEASGEDFRMIVNATQEMSQSIFKGFGDIKNSPMYQFQSQHASYNHGFSQPFTSMPVMTSTMNMPVSQHVASETRKYLYLQQLP